jgi:hypothetical protein
LLASERYVIFYNAYKHGYRLWVGKEGNVDVAIFRNKQGNESHVTIDYGSLEILMECGKYCLDVFNIVKNNHKSIYYYLRNPHVKTIKMKFLFDKCRDPMEVICEV